MIGKVSIEVTTDPSGNKQHQYTLHDGDTYSISRQWLRNCGLDIPRRGSLFHFGGKALVVTDERPAHPSIVAIEARRFWRLRFLLIPVGEWLQLIDRRIIITCAVWNLVELSPGVVPSLRDLLRRKKK